MTDRPQYINDLQPEIVAIESIKPDQGNNLIHEAKDLDAIANSLREFGQRTPIVVNRKTRIIEKGNGTWEAAKDYLKWQQIAVVWVDDDVVTAAAYSIADNLTGRIAEWNWPNLKVATDSMDNPEALPGMTSEFLDLIKNNADLENNEIDLDDVEFQEFDESIADSVEYHVCPNCEHKWPK